MTFYRVLLMTSLSLFASVTFASEALNVSESKDQAVQSSEQLTPSVPLKMNLNQASVKELMKLKGLNASKARAIVAYRNKNGHFKTLDELVKVKGFKKMKAAQLKEIQDQVSLEQ